MNDAPGGLGLVVSGPVETGDRRGLLLGFPTANVAVVEPSILPADGVYAGWVDLGDGLWRAAALSLGRRPTFYETRGQRLLEAHLIDFEGDLYGRVLRVTFVARLRDQRRFDGVDALIAQLRLDVSAARRVLAATHPA